MNEIIHRVPPGDILMIILGIGMIVCVGSYRLGLWRGRATANAQYDENGSIVRQMYTQEQVDEIKVSEGRRAEDLKEALEQSHDIIKQLLTTPLDEKES